MTGGGGRARAGFGGGGAGAGFGGVRAGAEFGGGREGCAGAQRGRGPGGRHPL